MTEAEKIAYAKSFIDKLANGINPLDDTPIPEEDIVNNVRLSRCFFYVSSILEKEIEREKRKETKATKPKKTRRGPFTITQERLAQFQYSPTSISAKVIAQKINWLIANEIREKRVKSLAYRSIMRWLSSLGFLEWQTWEDGTSKLLPTQSGKEIGLELHVWERYDRRLPYILFSEEAQRFFVDNFGSFLSANGLKFSAEETEQVKEQEEELQEE